MNRLQPSENVRSLTGNLLVASPSVVDPMFSRSVCLVLHHDQEGASALVLNRPIETPAHPIWEHILSGQSIAAPQTRLHFGGPLAGPVLAIHDQECLADGQDVNGVFVAAHLATLQKLVHFDPRHYRLIIGHAGWKQDQLQCEIDAGAWRVLPAARELVFSPEDQMWVRGLKRYGDLTIASIAGVANVPPVSWLN